MAGIPMVPVERVAGAIFRAASDKDPKTNGASYTLPDDGQVYLIPDLNIDEGVYGRLSDRAKGLKRQARTIQDRSKCSYIYTSFVDSIKTSVALTKMFVGSKFFKLILGAGVGYASYQVAVLKGVV